MEKVGFIEPNNHVEYITYSEVEDYCEQICNNLVNKDRFDEFKKDYTYFNPYFDFVTLEKEYVFINPLFGSEDLESGVILTCGIDNYLYEIIVPSKNYFDYNHILQKKAQFDSTFFIPLMSKCSDENMAIKKVSSEQIGDVLMDPFQMGMLCYNSHQVTANTVLNQILINSSEAADYYYQQVTEEFTDPLNHLLASYGFLRNVESVQIIMGNKPALSDESDKFISAAKMNGFIFHNLENDSQIKSNQYKSLRR